MKIWATPQNSNQKPSTRKWKHFSLSYSPDTQMEKYSKFWKNGRINFQIIPPNTTHCLPFTNTSIPSQSHFIISPSPNSKHNHHNQKWRPWLSAKEGTRRTSLLSLQSKPTLFLESPHLPPRLSGEDLGSLLLISPTSSTPHLNQLQLQLPTVALIFPHLYQFVH